MRIIKIMASRTELIFKTDTDGRATVREYPPVIGEALPLSQTEAPAQNGEMRIPRFDGGRDRLASRFEAGDGGVCFVTDLIPGASESDMPYPQPKVIKALGGTPEDVRSLGLHQTLCNVNLPAMMTTDANKDVLVYPADGKNYYFLRERVEKLDDFMRKSDSMGLLVTMILLNSPRLFGSTGEKELLDIVIHPQYEWDAKDAFISAFNMETEAGQGYYRAFVEFLAERYSREDKRYGRAMGMIISNEVNSQCVWGNAGEMTVDEYTREYSRAMRLAWLLSRKHSANFRVYLSLDQFFSGMRYRPPEPKHTYPGREVIEHINAHCLREGNFGWSVAYHPYPEDLRYPDFWNDRAPDFTYSTPKITFKNMEVLPDYLAQSHLLYEGAPRRIIFSEQGFNSQQGPLKALTEKQAAAAYCLAYMKARALNTVDLFTHHAYVDNPHEFGLNLGIRRYDPAKPDHLGEPKPIYESIRDMDTDRENARVAESRAFIGADLFDYLLTPPLSHADRDTASDTDFG